MQLGSFSPGATVSGTVLKVKTFEKLLFFQNHGWIQTFLFGGP